MVLFKYLRFHNKNQYRNHLHSTMVLFKCIALIIPSLNASPFTFHYGSIQIMKKFNLPQLRKYLHSTMVLFKLKKHFDVDAFLIYLHSTMVLFKFKSWKNLVFSNKFTFHYGSIQIEKNYKPWFFKIIYIPLWFYSNGTSQRRKSY